MPTGGEASPLLGQYSPTVRWFSEAVLVSGSCRFAETNVTPIITRKEKQTNALASLHPVAD